eukprot:Nitzschia sp. Nitz4//scaffold65_size103378//70939//72670//NITZ4_004473-RA/size103378-augustus-gene-0.87-mRNA-1//-1//CDS//3329556261//5510//frame0
MSAAAASSSCDVCGWTAAIIGILAFGSFGVPIRSQTAKSLDIDPLVMQTYKTTMCFLTSWLVLLYKGTEGFMITPWGIVSGLFWVPGGIATVYAIKTAGLAIGIGVGSSFIVLVSFTWGIFIFQEHVHSRLDACFALACMMSGLFGMAYYSSPTVVAEAELGLSQSHDEAVLTHHRDSDAEAGVGGSTTNYHRVETQPDSTSEPPSPPNAMESQSMVPQSDSLDSNEYMDEPVSQHSIHDCPSETHTVCFGAKWSRRTLGILAAMLVTGVYGGSAMVPMKWAPAGAKGSAYVISFACGASVVTLFFWIVRYLYQVYHLQSWVAGYYALPSFHLGKFWMYGCSCGTLWSIGNLCSIISVEFLGEGVGYSVVQSQLLVSGFWGIFYFHEVAGAEPIAKWLLCALMTVLGILLLSYEHGAK